MAVGKPIPRFRILYLEDVEEASDGLWMRAADVDLVFTPDTAYMPVPRCDQCRWWTRDIVSIPDPSPKRGECDLFADPESDRNQKRRQHRLARGWGDGPEVEASGFATHETFGCVQWERKP